MKRYLPILYALFIILACKGAVELTTPDVTYDVTTDGGGLDLSWTEVEDAEGYIIYADDVAIDTVTELSYTMTTPAKVVKVTAYAGEDESDAWSGDFTPVTTTSLNLWGLSQPPPDPSGLSFTSDGTGVGLAVGDTTNWPSIDFVIDDVNLSNIGIVTPNSGYYNSGQGLNSEYNYISNDQGVEFDSINIAPSAGSYYSEQEFIVNGVFAGWIDPGGGSSPDANDNFVKIKVESISGNQVVLKLAFQKEGGLRWLVTP